MLSIKLRCASWPQLATIYRRDLSKGTMFLKASTPPEIGTQVRIDLSLPSETVIALSGIVDKHVTDPQRGSGVELKLGALPETTIWMIESALAAEQKMRAMEPQPPPAGSGKVRAPTHPGGVPITGSAGSIAQSSRSTGPIQSLSDGQDLAQAEQELRDALTSEVESLKKLNPFLVLGVGYEATDPDVRAAFGELTKRYHPDRFTRYQSADLRQIAAEIFILIRDAYRRIGDDAGRAGVLQQLGRSPAPRAMPLPRAGGAPPPIPTRSRQIPAMSPTPSASTSQVIPQVVIAPPSAPIASQTPNLNTPSEPVVIASKPPPPLDAGPQVTTPMPMSQPLPPVRPTPQVLALPQKPVPSIQTERRPVGQMPAVLDGSTDTTALEELLDAGKIDEALASFKVLAKKHPNDRPFRAGIELCEGLKSLAQRDRLEAAQRFEAALEIDPSNERAARELVEMRRQATNERKGLLSRLMNKKE